MTPTNDDASEGRDRSRRGASRLAELGPAVLLAIVATLPCWPVLLAGRMLYHRDILLHYLPQKELAVSLIRQGVLPLWDPYLHGGQPLWANPGNVIVHPVTLAYLALPGALAFALETALHLALAAVGAYGLARALGTSRAGAVAAGATFALCGVMSSLVSLHPSFLALTPLPALLWAWHAWMRGAPARVLAVVAALAAMISLAGGAECQLAGLVLVGAWTFTVPTSRSLGTRLAALASCGALALALAAPGWVPAVDVIRTSSRGHGFGWNEATTWSLHPVRLLELVVPDLLGRIDRPGWAQGLEGRPVPYLGGIAVGPIVAVLAVLGAIGSSLPRALRRLLVVLTLASLVLSLGRHLPGVELVRHVPLHVPLRFPVKFLFLAVLPVAILAGAGFDVATRRCTDAARLRAPSAVFAGLAMVLGLAALGLWIAPSAADDFVRAALHLDPRGPTPWEGLAAAFGRAALQAAAGFACVALATMPAASRASRVLLAAALTAGLATTSLELNLTGPRRVLEPEPRLVPIVRATVGDGRLYRAEPTAASARAADRSSALSIARHRLDALELFVAARHGIPVVFHLDYDGLAPQRLAAVSQNLRGMTWRERLPWLRTAGVTAVLADESIAEAGYAEVDLSRVEPKAGVHLYRVEESAPTVRFVARLRVVPSEEAALAAVGEHAHDPRSEVVLVGRGGPPQVEGCSGHVERAALARANGQELQVDAGCDGMLVLALPLQPTVDVSVDGQPARVFAADSAFTAVSVPRGRHVVRWVHRPRGLAASLAASAAGLVGLAALAGSSLLRRPRAG